MAKPKLLTYREWQQKEREKKARAAASREALRQAKMQAWWAIPAVRNYVELDASWVDTDVGPVHCRTADTMHQPGEMMVHARVLPDKRRQGRNLSRVGIHLTVEAGATKEEVTNRLILLAARVFASDNLWNTANGPALERPVRFHGGPPHLEQQAPYPHAQAPRAPAATPQPDGTVIGLRSLRSQLATWLLAHRRDDSPLALLTTEQLAEVLVMITCGQDIALVSEQDPWRWEHTAEELRAVEEGLGESLRNLQGLASELNARLRPEDAIEVLLTVFVQGI
jgi:hypothetical protein